MKKRFFFLILLFVPILVKGETLVYNVCENGCEYDDINEVYDEILSLPRNVTHDITLNIKDGRSYSKRLSAFTIDIEQIIAIIVNKIFFIFIISLYLCYHTFIIVSTTMTILYFFIYFSQKKRLLHLFNFFKLISN